VKRALPQPSLPWAPGFPAPFTNFFSGERTEPLAREERLARFWWN
jgi:hypothetical protein